MNPKQQMELNTKVYEISNMAIDMAKDRRVLLDFLYTVAAAPKNGKYTHSREYLHQKALKIMDELDL
jgi:hypothetical protein